MRATNGIDAHSLEFDEFAMQRIFAKCSTQATEVMMLANAIDLEVLTIKPKARLCIEFKITETCGGF